MLVIFDEFGFCGDIPYSQSLVIGAGHDVHIVFHKLCHLNTPARAKQGQYKGNARVMQKSNAKVIIRAVDFHECQYTCNRAGVIKVI
jgi:hypothetical protein